MVAGSTCKRKKVQRCDVQYVLYALVLCILPCVERAFLNEILNEILHGRFELRGAKLSEGKGVFRIYLQDRYTNAWQVLMQLHFSPGCQKLCGLPLQVLSFHRFDVQQYKPGLRTLSKFYLDKAAEVVDMTEGVSLS